MENILSQGIEDIKTKMQEKSEIMFELPVHHTLVSSTYFKWFYMYFVRGILYS